jgi:hypothetical protein
MTKSVHGNKDGPAPPLPRPPPVTSSMPVPSGGGLYAANPNDYGPAEGDAPPNTGGRNDVWAC